MKPQPRLSSLSRRNRSLRVETLEDRRMLATFTVTNAANSGAGSLRFAISQANAAPGADEVVFASNVTGAINITSNLLITDDLTINGPGRDVLAIDANLQSRVINATGGDLTINDLTLREGRTTGDNAAVGDTFSGGGIRFTSLGELTLNNSAIVDSRTTGFRARGGGVFVSVGDITLNNSTVSGNRTEGDSAGGGGIAAFQASVTLVSSTVSGNSTTGDNAVGGGVQAGVGDVTINNSTVSGNFTTGVEAEGGGVHASIGDLNIFNSTITRNRTEGALSAGGGVFGPVFIPNPLADPTVTIRNAIVAGNTSVSFPGTDDLRVLDAGAAVVIDFSLIGEASGPAIDLSAGVGNVVGVDPRLAPLADNGGLTQTHALLPDSPAIDAGDPGFNPDINPTLPALDQRGGRFVRTADSDLDDVERLDIGAFERFSGLVVSNILDVADDNFERGALTLREAINIVNAGLPNEGVITFSPRTGNVFRLDSELPTITEDVTIVAAGDRVIISAGFVGESSIDGDGARIFTIDDGDATNQIDVTLQNLFLVGGDPSDSLGGGAIRSLENLEVLDSVLFNNTVVSGDGGAINSLGGDLTINRTTINNNRAGDDGGGVFFANGFFFLTNSTVSNNATTGSVFSTGGGLHFSGTGSIQQSTISGNLTEGSSSDGGGIFLDASLSISSSTITENRTLGSNSDGGGIFLASSNSLGLGSSVLSGNDSAGLGDDFGATPGAITLITVRNVLGTGVMTTNPINFFTDDPMLAPLADNGGPTETHLPQPGSPAIDAGPGGVSFDFDQRGTPFDRVSGARIDIGAVEVQVGLQGDFNFDLVVNAADYVVARDTGQDVALFQSNFGATASTVSASTDAALAGFVLVEDEEHEAGASPVEALAAPLIEDDQLLLAVGQLTAEADAAPRSLPDDEADETDNERLELAIAFDEL